MWPIISREELCVVIVEQIVPHWSLWLFDFLKEFADFLTDLLVNVDKAIIVGDFNIHVDNTNDALGAAFTHVLNSLGVKQNASGPTHRLNQTLDSIISYGTNATDIDIIPQSDDQTRQNNSSNHYR